MLIKDAKANVREFFIRCLGDWLISLPDRYDHEPRLAPYLISGLFDKDEGICYETYEIIEEVGLQYEREKEKEFRSIKQFGYEAEWTRGGKVTQIKLPKPIQKRPRLGARFFVRNHVRKFLPALYKEMKDWQFENRLEAINLLLYGLIYAEDFVTQFLDKFVVNILHNLNGKNKEDKIISEKTSQIFYYIGVYCSYKSYLPIIMAVLRGEISDYGGSTNSALIALNNVLTGFFETVLKEEGLEDRKKHIDDVIDFLSQEDFLSGIDKETAPIIEQIMHTIIQSLLEKCPLNDLENFYKERRPQAQSISFLVLRFRFLEFENKMSQKSLNQDFKQELNSIVDSNLLIQAWKKFDEIYEDLLLDSYSEIFQKNLTNKHLSSTQWKIIYTYFLVNISLRQHNCSKYDEEIFKILNLIEEVDINLYAKSVEILQMNVFMIKLISDSFSDEELTTTHSTLLFHAIQLSRKAYCSVEKNSEKASEFQEKLLLLSKVIFCKNINWTDAIQKVEGKAYLMNKIGKNIAELLQQIFNTTLKFQEDQEKEFKLKLNLFKKILSHFGLFLFKKSRYLKTANNKYIIPEIINYVVFLHEKFCNNDPEDVLPILFECLFTILMTIPDSTSDSFKGEEWIIPNYSVLLDRLIILAIDTTDNETKNKYKTVLKSLSKKTPFSILDQWEKAVQSQSMARIDLLSSLKKDIEA